MIHSDYSLKAEAEFTKARARENISRIVSLLKREDDDLLSLQDVKSLLKPKAECYRGIQTVPVNLIAGSEGRYRDFNKMFLPRSYTLKKRWMSIQKAHYENKILPPVKLYELGGVYFVRDGNHRVSVAVNNKVHYIDAEITALETEIDLSPGMSLESIKREVIQYEKSRFFAVTKLDALRPECELDFTATGRYDDIILHIKGHRYSLNQLHGGGISFRKALLSWYDTVYLPIVSIIHEEQLLKSFPGRTESDLYVWIVRHWDELKGKYGDDYPIANAARDLKNKFGMKRHFLLTKKKSNQVK
jgi:hypothetical protein